MKQPAISVIVPVYNTSRYLKRCLNSLVNPEYNKRSNKADQFKDGKHITFTDMKRIDHDFRHMSKNPKDLNRILNGGDKMAHFVKDTLNKERTKVKPVNVVPQITDNNKSQLNNSSIYNFVTQLIEIK